MKPLVYTSNFEVYNKLNELKHKPFVFIKDNFIKEYGLFRIINNINKRSNNVRIKKVDNGFILEKLNGNLDYNLYYTKKERY